jgi:hypothetical protein
VKESKTQYVVFHIHRSEQGRPTYTLVAGPGNLEQALAACERLWEQEGQWAVIRAIENAFYLPLTSPWRCTCCESMPDSTCLFGPYLFQYARDLEMLVQHQGFLFLSTDLQDRIRQEQAGWSAKYGQHVLQQEGQKL